MCTTVDLNKVRDLKELKAMIEELPEEIIAPEEFNKEGETEDMPKEKYCELVDKYGTINPFELAECMDMTVKFRPLGQLNGYYLSSNGIKLVTVNSDMTQQAKQRALMFGLIAAQSFHGSAFRLIGDFA